MRALLAFLFFFSTSVGAMHWSSFPGRFDCPAINNSQICARSIEEQLGADFVRRVHDSRLEVDLLNGEIYAFEDGETESFTALEIDKTQRYVVLHRQFYEGSGYGLMDRTNGNFLKLTGYPVFSSDFKWMVVAAMDVDAGYSPNALKIYRINEEAVELEFDANPSDWGPVEVAWLSPTSLTYVHADYQCYYMKQRACNVVRINYDGSTWK